MIVVLAEKVTLDLQTWLANQEEDFLVFSWTDNLAYETQAYEVNAFDFMRERVGESALTVDRLPVVSSYIANAAGEVLSGTSKVGQVKTVDDRGMIVNEVDDLFEDGALALTRRYSQDGVLRKRLTYDTAGLPVLTEYIGDDRSLKLWWMKDQTRPRIMMVDWETQNSHNQFVHYRDWLSAILEAQLSITKPKNVLAWDDFIGDTSLVTDRISR